jgi:hypothetical protein
MWQEQAMLLLVSHHLLHARNLSTLQPPSPTAPTTQQISNVPQTAMLCVLRSSWLHTAAWASHLDDARTRGLCEAQGHHTQLGHVEQAHVVGDGAHNHADLRLLRVWTSALADTGPAHRLTP